MRILRAPQPFERGDWLVCCCPHGRVARRNGVSVDQHVAGTALRRATAEARRFQAEVVAQDVDERRGFIGGDDVLGTVHSDCERWHGVSRPSLLTLARPLPTWRYLRERIARILQRSCSSIRRLAWTTRP